MAAGSQSSAETEQSDLKPRPDGRLSWKMAASCCSINLFIMVIMRTRAITYIAISDHYKVSREAASWPVSLIGVASGVIEPFAGNIVNKCGKKPTGLAATVLSAAAIISCFFVPDVLILDVVLGVVHGLSLGVLKAFNGIYLNQWFDRKKVLAGAIIYVGHSIGAYAFPLVFTNVYHTLGFPICILTLGLISTLAIVPTIFVKAPPWLPSEDRNTSYSQPRPTANEPAQSNDGFVVENTWGNSESSIIEIVCTNKNNCTQKQSKLDDMCDPDPKSESVSTKSDSELFYIYNPASDKANCADTHSSQVFLANGNLHCQNSQKKESSKNVLGGAMSYVQPLYILLCVSNIVFVFSSTSFAMIILDFGADYGNEPVQVFNLLFVIASGDIVGRITTGYICSKKLLKTSTIVSLTLALSGTALILMPVFPSLEGLAVICVVQGFACGGTVDLFNPLTADFLGVDKLAVSLVWMSFLSGLSGLGRAGMIGYYHDTHGSYDGMVRVMSYCLLGCSAVWLFISVLEKLQTKKWVIKASYGFNQKLSERYIHSAFDTAS